MAKNCLCKVQQKDNIYVFGIQNRYVCTKLGCREKLLKKLKDVEIIVQSFLETKTGKPGSKSKGNLAKNVFGKRAEIGVGLQRIRMGHVHKIFL